MPSSCALSAGTPVTVSFSSTQPATSGIQAALINALGEQIGVVSNKNPDEENINFAIPIDRVLKNLNELFAPKSAEEFYRITLDPLESAKIVKVTKKSPAAKLGLRPGDILKSVNGKPLGSCLDWFAHLLVQKVDNELKLSVSQGKKTRAVAQTYGTPHPTDA